MTMTAATDDDAVAGRRPFCARRPSRPTRIDADENPLTRNPRAVPDRAGTAPGDAGDPGFRSSGPARTDSECWAREAGGDRALERRRSPGPCPHGPQIVAGCGEAGGRPLRAPVRWDHGGPGEPQGRHRAWWAGTEECIGPPPRLQDGAWSGGGAEEGDGGDLLDRDRDLGS